MIDKNFNKYYKIYNSFKENSNSNDIHLLEKELKITKKEKVLDLGCGYGRISNLLLNKGYNILGIDYSEEFIKEAILNIKEPKKYTIGDFTNLNKYFENDFFDKIYSLYSSIGHTSRIDDEKTFEGVSNILKKGGIFLLEYENFIYHSQFTNLVKHDYYDIDTKYRRILDINVDLYNSKINIGNEFWNLKSNKKLLDWNFKLNLYTYLEIINLGKKHGLDLVKIRGQYSDNEVFWYEPEAVFIFKKIK